MVSKKSITAFVASFLIFGFMLLALPQSGQAEIDPGCCQYGITQGERSCITTGFDVCPRPLPGISLDGFFPGEVCNQETGFCSGVDPLSREIPTLSEWGLIAMAGVLGVVGFMVIRRKRAAA